MRHHDDATLYSECEPAHPLPESHGEQRSRGEGETDADTYRLKRNTRRNTAYIQAISRHWSRAKYLQEDAQYIPYSDGKKFTLAATAIVGKSGKQIPLMECGAAYEDSPRRTRRRSHTGKHRQGQHARNISWTKDR